MGHFHASSWVSDRVERMQRAFHGLRREIALNTVCVCDACRQASDLRVKFIVHAGPARLHRQRGLVDLAGFEVVVAHRQLKVHVPADEYLLATEGVLARMASSCGAAPLAAELEGVGPVALGYFALRAPREDEAGSLPLWLRWKISLSRTWRTLPGMLGFQKPCAGFRNVPDPAVVRAAA